MNRVLVAVACFSLASASFAVGQTLTVEDKGPPNGYSSRGPSIDVSADLFQTYFAFDGLNDFIRVPKTACLDFGGDTSFTVEVWFRKAANAEFDLVNKGESVCGWRLYVGVMHTDPFHPGDPPQLAPSGVGVQACNKRYNVVQNVFPVINNQWCHVALTVDRASGETTLSLHRSDGSSRKWSTDWLLSDPMNLSAPQCDLGIGYRGGEPGKSDWFRGDIAEVRIWNTARSEDQIQATLADTLSPVYYGSPDSGLVLYYRFDRLEELGVGGEGKDVRDLSIHGNHGAYQGATVGIADRGEWDLPARVALLQNYPNPFNPSTTIGYALPQAGYVTLKVYSALGQEVATLLAGDHAAGEFRTSWDASDVPTGVYFYRLTVGGYVQTRRMILMR